MKNRKINFIIMEISDFEHNLMFSLFIISSHNPTFFSSNSRQIHLFRKLLVVNTKAVKYSLTFNKKCFLEILVLVSEKQNSIIR